MKTLLHPPLLESWALNTLAVKPQETKHGPTCCLRESPVNSTVHDKLENLALCGLTPSSTCKESLNASQSSLVSQYWKARKFDSDWRVWYVSDYCIKDDLAAIDAWNKDLPLGRAGRLWLVASPDWPLLHKENDSRHSIDGGIEPQSHAVQACLSKLPSMSLGSYCHQSVFSWIRRLPAQLQICTVLSNCLPNVATLKG